MNNFNQGSLPFELIINSNTIINNLGVFNIKKNIHAVQTSIIQLPNIPEYLNQYIRKY